MTDRVFTVTVIIVTYQSRKTIGSTLDALKRAYDSRLAAVVVVDNASQDETVDIVSENYPWVTLVRNTRNIGFGRGCNCGFNYVKTPYLMFLNPDAVIGFQSLTTMLAFMDQDRRVGMCGPSIKEPSGGVHFVGALPTPARILFMPLFSGWATRGRRYVYPGEAPAVTEWICGACMLLRKEVFEKVGGFDSRFFLYFEETDLCLRVRQLGWEIWTVGESICEHINAASAKETKAHMRGDTISEHYYKSRFYYMVKNFGLVWAIVAEIGEIVFMGLRVVVDFVRRRPYRSFRSRFQAPILKFPTFPDGRGRKE